MINEYVWRTVEFTNNPHISNERPALLLYYWHIFVFASPLIFVPSFVLLWNTSNKCLLTYIMRYLKKRKKHKILTFPSQMSKVYQSPLGFFCHVFRSLFQHLCISITTFIYFVIESLLLLRNFTKVCVTGHFILI